MILKYIQGSEQQSQAPSRCFSPLYPYLHRTSASMGRVHSRSCKWPALSLNCSSHPGPTEMWSAALNLFLGECCHHMPIMQKRGSALSMVQFTEYYEKKRSRINYSSSRGGDRSLDIIQTGSRVQNCVYNVTKRNKLECLLNTFLQTPLPVYSV